MLADVLKHPFLKRESLVSYASKGGNIAQWLAYLLLYPAALGSIPSIPKKNSEEKIVDVAEVNQRRSLEENEQWLHNVDLTHCVLACGKLGLATKRLCIKSIIP